MRAQLQRVVAATLAVAVMSLTCMVLSEAPASAAIRPTVGTVTGKIDCGTLQDGYYAAMDVSTSVTDLQPGASYQLTFSTASNNTSLENDIAITGDDLGSAVVDVALTGRFVASGHYDAILKSGSTTITTRFFIPSACTSGVSPAGAPTFAFVCASRFLIPNGVMGTSFHLGGVMSGFVPGEVYRLVIADAPLTAIATADANGRLTYDMTAINGWRTNQTTYAWSVWTTSQFAAVASGTVALTSDCAPIRKAVKRAALTHDGDLTGDGYADLLAVDWNGDLWQYTNGVKSNPGHLPFTSGRLIGSGWSNSGPIQQIAEGDLTGDGYADLVAIRSDGVLLAYYNNVCSNPGRMPFTSGVAIGSAWQPFVRVAVGDVNGDGYADIIAGKADGTNYFYQNRYASDPRHRPFSSGVKLDGEAFPWWGEVAAGDVNGDGYADLTTEGTSLDPNRLPAGSPTPFVKSFQLGWNGASTRNPYAGWSLGDYEGRGSDGLLFASPSDNGQLVYVKDPLGAASASVIGSGWQKFWILIH